MGITIFRLAEGELRLKAADAPNALRFFQDKKTMDYLTKYPESRHSLSSMCLKNSLEVNWGILEQQSSGASRCGSSQI